MSLEDTVRDFLTQEALALLTRLQGVKSFALNMPMVNAAAISTRAFESIERHLAMVRKDLARRVHDYMEWLKGPVGRRASPSEMQSVFTVLRLKFNSVLDQLDIFADVFTQRSEHENGVWLSGLDVAAADALTLRGGFYKAPPLVCYLDRGHGAAIRRVRTRLPGGRKNPVAVIRVPRERMVGSGIASSLFHEVGHQGAALLDLINSMRSALRARKSADEEGKTAWDYFERCISEIIADFWSVAKVGVASTHGLMSVVSLPRWFVFRINMDDPHPFPWIRVKLSCAMGRALYPHSQWERLERLWEMFYPVKGQNKERRRIISILEAKIPEFVDLLANHRPGALRGKALKEVFHLEERTPARLRKLHGSWRSGPARSGALSPSLLFAAVGQSRADGRINPAEESSAVSNMLTSWALKKPATAPAMRTRTQQTLALATTT